MTQLTAFDATEIQTWLTRITQSIERSLREPERATALENVRRGLEGATVGFPVLALMGLLDDCLRVSHLAIEADGRIEAEEIARVTDLLRIAANQYAGVLPTYARFGEPKGVASDLAAFMQAYRVDSGPFGYANAQPWRGLELVRSVERHSRNAGPFREHERMLARIMDVVFAGRSTEIERKARKRLRELFEPITTHVGADPRATAFCRADGPEVFASIAHGSQIHQADPFDVEAIHAEARDVFQSQLVRATTPAYHEHGHGRTLLILGDSGAGKTHLLRALRAQVHSQRHGYVGYLQMSSEVGDYARYVLRNLIDSLERPYEPPALSESGLMYLSNGLAEGNRVDIPRGELERLRTAELSADDLDAVIGTIIDRIVRTEGLEHLETDLLHALLLLQRRDAALQRRIVKYLRCEALGTHDRRLLGGLATRDQPEDPLRTLKQLGTIIYELQMASLVLLVDQIEDTVPDGVTATRIQQAFDSLRAIADSLPSAVVVISCLTDVYDALRPKLTQSLVDRLEHDPPPVRLTSQRESLEIEAMLTRRLEHLYSAFDVPWRDDDPLFPFSRELVDAVSKLRARDCLARFREFHASCIAAQRLPTTSPDVEAPSTVSTQPPAPPPAPASADLSSAWNDALVAATSLPEDDAGVLELVQEGLRAAALEAGIQLTFRGERAGADARLVVEGTTLGKRLLGVANRGPQGGHLGRQLESLKTSAGLVTTYALRSSDWKFPAKTKTALQVGELIQAGGRPLVISEHELRAVLASRVLANVPGFATWRASARPLAQLPFVRAVLELDNIKAVPPPSAATPAPSPAAAPPLRPPSPSTPPPKRESSPSIAAVDPARVRIGTTTTMRKEPISLPVEQFKTHIAYLGTTGSGKTTAALAAIEQLLERGIPVLLVDRKGDLARYASDRWWRDSASPDHARRSALRDRIDVDLFTPGNASGRPLRLPLIPPLGDASPQECEQLAKFAASGLATMMGYGSGTTNKHKQAVLQCAIGLHAAEREVTIEILSDTISRPDPELLSAVGNLQRFFAPLSEDLQSLKIQRGSLLGGGGESLDVASMLASHSGRARLTIINTSALVEVPVLQFWVSRLLIELGRLARKRPSAMLQAAAFFDEADAYVPATSTPPTKEPMFDLLRRARSGGLGILLATQNPGDFDYKARDLIGTWLVGRVAQDRAIEKMRNLLGAYPNVSSRLANQATGSFFVLGAGQPMEIQSERSLMQTEQLTESELVALASARPR